MLDKVISAVRMNTSKQQSSEGKQVMNANQVIELAEKNIANAALIGSAKLCLQDAKDCLAKGDEGYAFNRALKSLQYSIGIFHPDYKAAQQGVEV